MRVKKQGFRPAAWLGVQLINNKKDAWILSKRPFCYWKSL